MMINQMRSLGTKVEVVTLTSYAYLYFSHDVILPKIKSDQSINQLRNQSVN